jgi:hypothetical protein
MSTNVSPLSSVKRASNELQNRLHVILYCRAKAVKRFRKRSPPFISPINLSKYPSMRNTRTSRNLRGPRPQATKGVSQIKRRRVQRSKQPPTGRFHQSQARTTKECLMVTSRTLQTCLTLRAKTSKMFPMSTPKTTATKWRHSPSRAYNRASNKVRDLAPNKLLSRGLARIKLVLRKNPNYRRLSPPRVKQVSRN